MTQVYLHLKLKRHLSFCCIQPRVSGRRLIIGTYSPIILGDVETVEWQEHVNIICKKYGLIVGNSNGKSQSQNQIPIHTLFEEDFTVYEGHNRHEAISRVMESLIKRTHGILSLKQIVDICKDWNNIHCSPPLDEREFQKQWKSAEEFIIRGNGNGTGDSKDKSESESKSEQRISPEDIAFVLRTIKKEAPHDEVSIKQLFYGMNSAFTKIPIHHNINSRKAGAGKTYDLTLTAGYFPNKYVLPLAGVSDKGFIHEEGVQVIVDEDTGETTPIGPLVSDLKLAIESLQEKMNLSDAKLTKSKKNQYKKQIKDYESEIKELYSKSQKLIILDNRIILVLDTAQEGLFNALMSIISQDTPRDQVYQFTDKKGSGKLGATKNRLRGTPCMFTSQVIDDTRQTRYQEKNRRFVHVTPNTSKEKINTAMNMIGQKYGLTSEEYDTEVVSEEDKKRAKEIVNTIVEKLIEHSELFKPKESGVKVTFYQSIAHGLTSSMSNINEWGRMMRYLAIITKVNMDSRPKIVDTKTGVFYPLHLESVNNGSSIR